jgi:TonB-linked SusC/RagA family outer membrane protein
MKKAFHYGMHTAANHRSLLKTLLFMKMTIALIMFTAFHSFAGNVKAQNVHIKLKQAELTKVFKAIEKQSPYRFLYNYDLLQLQKKVDVEVANTPVSNLLDNVLTNSGLEYKLLDNKLIVVVPKESTVAEGRKISGTVLSEKGEPLIGANIMVKGTKNGTSTGDKGTFNLTVPENAILVVSYINYETQEITIGTNSSFVIKLKQADNELNQIVVVGYGTQKKKDLTGSLSTISSKDLENRANTQFGYAIEGKTSGVQVIRSSGQPQAGFSIRVRGTASITSSSDPLYVVDGVPTYNTSEINPADIENITILKDASSAAIFGSSGANGVVLITTKRGKSQKFKLSYNASITSSTAWKKMDVLNADQFKALATEMGGSTDWTKYTANTNWQDEIFRNAISQNHQLSATGGNDKTTYYLSGSINDQKGIVLNNSLKRNTLKANIDHQISNKIKVGTSIAYDSWKDIDVSENNRNGVITRLFTSIPNIGIRDKEDPTMYARSPFINDLENPVSTVYQPDHLNANKRFHGNVYAEAELIKGLKIKSLYGMENSKGTFTSFQDMIQTRYGKSSKGLAVENTFDYKYWISENTVNYNKAIKDHNISVLAGFIVSRETQDNVYKNARDFSAAGSNTNVDAGAVKSPAIPDYYQKSHMSYLGRINYSYKDKYYVTSNFRADGSGQFSEKNRWGFFPSFSTGWRVSKEDFFKDVKSISELKIRAGWGLVGNDRAQPYAWYGLVDTNSNKYLIGGITRTGYTPNTLENSDLKWEKTSQLDLGVDIAFLNNRISLTADYYVKKTQDMLLDLPIPSSTGFTRALQNVGSLENRGVEVQLTTRNIAKKDFGWTSDFNISFNRNKVISITGSTILTGVVNPAGSEYNTAIVKEGEPLGSFYGKYSQGVDPATGNIKYLKNLAGKDSTGIIGNANPKFIFGFTNSIRYKNWSLDLFIQGVQGNQILNATKILSESMSLIMNQSATVLNRWKNPGDVTSIPKATPNNLDNSLPSTRFIEDGSYVRVKALTLSYNFNTAGLNKLKISRCVVYLTAENLLTFTKYSGFDPQVSAFSAKNESAKNQNTAPGVDFGTYPQSRDIILGLRVSF